MTGKYQDILDRATVFGINIAKYYISLKNKKYYEIASQLFKSGTSIGANISEAQSGSSKKDFINKMNIALKEGKETIYWFKILKDGFDETVGELESECQELNKIIASIIINTKKNM